MRTQLTFLGRCRSVNFSPLSLLRRTTLKIVLLLVLSIAPLATLAPAQAANGTITLYGTVTPALKGARLLGPTDPAQQLDLAITLPTQHADELTALLHDLYKL